jgi:hypothetical protein
MGSSILPHAGAVPIRGSIGFRLVDDGENVSFKRAPNDGADADAASSWRRRRVCSIAGGAKKVGFAEVANLRFIGMRT